MAEPNSQDSNEKWGKQYTSPSDLAMAKERAEQRAASELVTSRGDRWRDMQPSKTLLVWCCVGAVALTMLVGFQWGGWHTANGATTLATSAAKDAVIEQLVPICVAQFNLDPARNEKLIAMKDVSSYQQASYVTDQQWATMPGAEKPVSKVADACAKLILSAND